MIRGRFAFGEAKKNDYWYNLISKGDKETYFRYIDSENTLTNEFKELVFWMLTEDGSKRPSIEQIRKHPWMMKRSADESLIRASLLNKKRN